MNKILVFSIKVFCTLFLVSGLEHTMAQLIPFGFWQNSASVSCTPGSTTYSTPGADTFTVPAGCDLVKIQAWGGGGGGGGDASGRTDGSNGADSVVDSTYTAGGGDGGIQGNGGAGGAGGTASGGTINLSGGAGDLGTYNIGGAGGDAANLAAGGGTGGAENSGSNSDGDPGVVAGGGGAGAESGSNGGAGGGGGGAYVEEVYSVSGGQSIGLTVGAGGSGGSGSRVGGAGADGKVIISYFSAGFQPDAFDFTDVALATASTVTSSDIVQITGLTETVDVVVSGSGSPEYRVCSDATCTTEIQTWTTSTTTLDNNEYVQLRLTSHATSGESYTALLDVGYGQADWAVTTEDTDPDSFNFANLTGITPSTLTASNILQITGINTAAAVSVSGDGSPEFRTCSNSDCSTEIQTWTSVANTISNNQYIQLRMTSNASANTTDTVTLNVGSGSDNWSVTTYDTNPNNFNFVDVTGAAVSTLTVSSILRIQGINTAVAVTISGAGSPQFRTCSNSDCSTEIQTWTSAANTISNNEYLQLRLTSNAAENASDTATINVGTDSDDWAVYTVDTDPVAFDFTDQTLLSYGVLTESDIVQITGIDAAATVAVSGDDSPQFRTCSNADCSTEIQTWTSTSDTISNNQYIQLRANSHGTALGVHTVDLDVGVDSVDWVLTTKETNRPEGFTFTDVTEIGVSVGVQSEILQILDFSGPASVSVTGSGTPEYRICSNSDCSTVLTDWTTTANNMNEDEYLQVRATANASAPVTDSFTVTVGLTSDTWSITTTDGDRETILTSGTSWTVPSDWDSSDNSIECIGGGGRGGEDSFWGTGGGGGGAAYAGITNLTLTPSSSVSYQIGVGGTGGSIDGTDSWFNTVGTVLAKGGSGGHATSGAGGAGGSAASSVGTTKFSGGNGKSGGGFLGGLFGDGGGGGAGGPNGAGGNGDGGGGGNGGGANASGNTGGNNSLGSGGGSNGVAGTNGGGGGKDGAGGNGVDLNGTIGSGGGGGLNGAGGLYGAGGGGNEIDGAPGVCRITYLGDLTVTSLSFTDQTGVALSTLTNSNIIQVAGISDGVSVSLVGDGDAQYRTCSDASCTTEIQTWTSAVGAIDNNDYLQLRLTSSSSNVTTFTANIFVGESSDTWSVTTAP